jgi:hypothetical protein
LIAAAGADLAIAGRCDTENIGIEKVVLNLLANSRIRWLVLCGVEAVGHRAADAFLRLKDARRRFAQRQLFGCVGVEALTEELQNTASMKATENDEGRKKKESQSHFQKPGFDSLSRQVFRPVKLGLLDDNLIRLMRCQGICPLRRFAFYESPFHTHPG